MLCCSDVFSSTRFSSYWELRRDTQIVKTWKLKKTKGVYASLTTKKVETKAPLEKKDYLENFEKDKVRILSFVGVSNWQSTKINWSVVNGHPALEIHGKYVDRKNEVISFVEFHYFKDEQIIQMLYVAPETFKTQRKYYQSFFKRYSR